MSKKKIILIVLVVAVIAIVARIYWWETHKVCGDCGAPKVRDAVQKSQRLADPDLLYFSSYWYLYSNENDQHEIGLYIVENYLYFSGRLLRETRLEGMADTGDIDKSIEIKLESDSVSNIEKQIRDSGLITKDCPKGAIFDGTSFEYQINFDGVKKSFHNPPEDCRAIFDSIDDAIVSYTP